MSTSTVNDLGFKLFREEESFHNFGGTSWGSFTFFRVYIQANGGLQNGYVTRLSAEVMGVNLQMLPLIF